jgi:hypothetical protein
MFNIFTLPSYQEMVFEITAWSGLEKKEIFDTATKGNIVVLERISELHHICEKLFLFGKQTPEQMHLFLTTGATKRSKPRLELIKNGKFELLNEKLESIYG